MTDTHVLQNDEIRPAAHRADTKVQEQIDPTYRGFKSGSVFFGWLIAVATTVLATGTIGAVTAAVDYTVNINWNAAEQQAGTIGVASGAVLLAMMAVAYYTGGYVAGRLARFDGARQGLGVWAIGLVVTLIVGGLGALYGAEYNVLDRIDVPTVPWSNDTVTTGGVVLVAALVVVTMLAAVLGGKAGQRYHRKIDTSWS